MSPGCCVCYPSPPCRAVLCERTKRHPSRAHAHDMHASLARWRAEASTLEQLRQNVLAVLTGVFERGEEVPVVVSVRWLLLLLLLGSVAFVCVCVCVFLLGGVGLGWGAVGWGGGCMVFARQHYEGVVFCKQEVGETLSHPSSLALMTPCLTLALSSEHPSCVILCCNTRRVRGMVCVRA